MADKIRIGVLGAGRWGPNLIRNFHSDPRSTVVAVADPSSERLKLIGERYGKEIHTTESPGEVLTSPNVDAVVICTPTETHFELAAKALESGKHVFVEKPLARTSQQCQDLIALARKHKRVLFVGHVFVYNAGIQAVKEYIDRGELGRIYHMQITRTNLGPVRTDVNALWDLASHDLSILNYWLGEVPLSVSAVGGCYLNKKIEDTVFASYRFKNDLIANIHVSWLNPKKVREITIVGEKKMLVWDDMNVDKPIQLYDKSVTMVDPGGSDKKIVDTFISFRASIHEGDTFIPKIALNEPLKAECMAYLTALTKPETSLSDGTRGKLVVEALAGTDESIRENGREVKIRYSENS